MLERPLRPGEDSLDDLERAFRETPVDPPAPKAAKPAPAEPAKDDPTKIANQSIRVTVDTLEHLMTMVSELVLTRNQLLEIVRRHEDSEFKVPLQRLSNVTAELQEGVMKTRMQPIGNAWQKLLCVVRDLSDELGKDIELEMQGGETELDRQVLEASKTRLTIWCAIGRPRLGIAGTAARGRQARARAHPAVGLSRRRPHHHSGRR